MATCYQYLLKKFLTNKKALQYVSLAFVVPGGGWSQVWYYLPATSGGMPSSAILGGAVLEGGGAVLCHPVGCHRGVGGAVHDTPSLPVNRMNHRQV